MVTSGGHGRSAADPIRLRVRYEGRVQGVGFRYTTQRLAAGFPVTGYVMNVWDGAVDMAVQGPAGHVEDFLQSVRTSSLARYISRETSCSMPLENKEKDFRVRASS